MDIWRILGLEGKTEDKDVIQEAYMERLMHVNPEDDPEGSSCGRRLKRQ